MKIRLNSNSELLCPQCDSEYLHHVGIVIYDRAREDRDTSILVISQPHRVPRPLMTNPSARRSAVGILFQCENCDSDAFELTLAQHKGVTQIEWRPATAAGKDIGE
jgi:hypothetical protein